MDNASPNHYSVEEYPGTQATKNFTVSFPSDKVLLYFVEYRTVFSVIKIDLFKPGQHFAPSQAPAHQLNRISR